jgi:hypothetical protein
MQVTRTAVPAEFRYLVLGGGDEFRVVVLDLNAGRAARVATARIVFPLRAPIAPSAAVAASADGRTVLVTFDVPDASDSLFVIRPETGDARLLVRGEIRGTAISADGAHVAVGRNDEDPSLTGLWIGSADGAMRRLVADDPHSNASPPLPYAFSPDGALIAFGVGLGESGREATVVATSNGSARKLGDAVFVVDMWWSRDGSRLFAEVGGDDATGSVTDLLTGESVMQFCRREAVRHPLRVPSGRGW